MTSQISVPSTSHGSSSARGRGRGGRSRGDDPPDVKYSKALSYILRHGAEKEGLKMRSDGYVRVDEILKRPKLKGLDLPMLEQLVASNEKQRFKLISEADPAKPESELLWIRANQDELPTVIHGTYKRFWPAIGLKAMTRSHIHCATGMFGSEGVKSGMRSSCDLFIHIAVAKAMSEGVVFVLSSNGVVLTKGIDGVLAPRFFSKVVDRQGGEVVPPP